jgi:hypothetical protein
MALLGDYPTASTMALLGRRWRTNAAKRLTHLPAVMAREVRPYQRKHPERGRLM